jgi:hypothetical protein
MSAGVFLIPAKCFPGWLPQQVVNLLLRQPCSLGISFHIVAVQLLGQEFHLELVLDDQFSDLVRPSPNGNQALDWLDGHVC